MHGPGRGARLLIIGARATELGLADGLGGLKTAPTGDIVEMSQLAPVTAQLLDALASSEVVLLALGSRGFSFEARHICLLGLHLSGSLPIVLADPAGVPAAKDAIASYATALGVPEPAVVTDKGSLSSIIAETLRARAESRKAAPLRMWLQPGSGDPDTVVSGTIVSGVAKSGLEVVILPAAQTAVVTRAETGVGPEDLAIVHLDRPLSAKTGDILSAAVARPEIADQVAAHIVWFDDHPLLPGRPYVLRLGSQSVTAQIGALKHKVNPADLDPMAARTLERAEVGLCNVSFSAPIAFDQAAASGRLSPETGRFTLEEQGTGKILGVGRVAFTLRRATNIHWQALAVDKTARAHLKGQRPCCLWFTGLSGSGKSTVASLLEKRLNSLGRHTYTLDGDNVRHGLNRDLGFTDADRVENIRRVAEVSKLFVDAGLIVMVSFISPFRAERELARALYPDGEFLEIFVDTPIEVCERRDPKGLYRKARAGQLKNFTGIDSPYEPPQRPELRLDAGHAEPEELVEQILRELMRRGMV